MKAGKLLTGADIPAAAAVVEGLGANVIGLNCGLGPKQMLALLPQLRAACSPSHRCQRQCRAARGGRGADLLFGGTGGLCRRLPRALLEAGAAIVGGCCGTTPEHISAMVRACRGCTVVPPPAHRHTLAASYTHTAELGRAPSSSVND